jgi:hypothetical protein
LLLPKTPAGAWLTLAAMNGTSPTTAAGTANRIELAYLAPFPFAVTIDTLGIQVSTLVASALARVGIYSVTANGWPGSLLAQTPSTYDCGSTGAKTQAVSFTFAANTAYWVAIHHSSTATLRAVPVAALPPLPVTTSGQTSMNTALRRSVAFASNLPATWNFVTTDLAANAAVTLVRAKVV